MFLIYYLEAKLRVALRVLQHRHDVVHHHFVNGLTVYNNGQPVYLFISYRLQVLNIVDAKVVVVAVPVSLRALARKINGAAHYHHAFPLSPFLTKEGYLARSTKVFYRHEATRLSGSRKFVLHIGNHSSENHVSLFGQLGLVAQFGARCVAHALQHDAEFVQRMGRKIDSHQIMFAIQFLDVTPQLWFRNGRCGNFYGIYTAKQRMFYF